MSNIFVGSYLNALAKMMNMKIFPSVPHVATDMAQAIVDFVLIKVAKSADSLLCIKTEINIEGHNIDGQFVLIFEEESLKKILNCLHEQYGLER